MRPFTAGILIAVIGFVGFASGISLDTVKTCKKLDTAIKRD